jgi:hypothetical protein
MLQHPNACTWYARVQLHHSKEEMQSVAAQNTARPRHYASGKQTPFPSGISAQQPHVSAAAGSTWLYMLQIASLHKSSNQSLQHHIPMRYRSQGLQVGTLTYQGVGGLAGASGD